MKLLLVDDEYLALKEMERKLNELDQSGEIQIVGMCTDAREAVKKTGLLQPDVVFLDISMPEVDGLSIADQIKKQYPGVHIVFVTAFYQHAIKAFELNAVDYLLKPVHIDRLAKTIERLKERIKGRPVMVSEHPSVLLQCFQRLQIWTDRVLDVPWRTAKAQELFAYFIHIRPNSAHKDMLLEVLWPDTAPEKSVNLLYTAIYQIRQMLRSLRLDGRIVNRNSFYMMDFERYSVDVDIWEKKLQGTPELTGENVAVHEYIFNSYGGDYLSDHGYVWAEDEKERLRLLRLQHALRLGQFYMDHDQLDKGLQHYHRLLQEFPSLETVYFQLMKAYERLGNWSSVEKYYHHLTQTMREEYDAVPDAQITEWFEQQKRKRN